MEISHSYYIERRISKDFIIDVDGVEIAINKYIYDSGNEINNDWNFIKSSDKEAYESLDPEKQEEFDDLVLELEL